MFRARGSVSGSWGWAGVGGLLLRLVVEVEVMDVIVVVVLVVVVWVIRGVELGRRRRGRFTAARELWLRILTMVEDSMWP